MKDMRSVLLEVLDNESTSGEIVRTLRVQRGFSQDDLQEITGIARTNISALENGRKEVTHHYAMIFAAALQIHPADILFPNKSFFKTTQFKKIEKKAESFLKRKA